MPVGQPPERDETPLEGATVVDPKVLAERRARRAEMAEESLLSRVNRAEQDRVLLATRLAEAEHELSAARTGREALTKDLERRERELRIAEQREFAEQQRRVEAEDETVQARRTTRGDVDALRRQVQASEQRIDELGGELEVARRDAAEAARAAAQAQARADRRTTGGGERRAVPAEQEQDLRGRVAEVERLERWAREVGEKLDRRRESLETEIVTLQSFADELDGTLRTEHERRLALEAELAAERERSSAEVTLLQHELDRRTEERDTATAERDRLMTALEAVRAQLDEARDSIAYRDRMLGEADRLRSSATELQRREFDRRVADLEVSACGLRAQALGAAGVFEIRLSAERAAKDAALAALEEERARHGEQRSERAARAAAADLTAERERGRDDRIAAADAARIQKALEVEQGRAAQAGIVDAGLFATTARKARPSPPELPVVPDPDVPVAPPVGFDTTGLDAQTASLIGDLQAAADRLRAQVAATGVDSPGRSAMEPSGTEPPAPDPGPAAALPPLPTAVTHPGPDGVRVLTTGAATGPPGGWLAPALAGLAATDPGIVSRLLPAVLAVHARRTNRDLAYDLVAEGVGSWHVQLVGGVATVDRREGGTGDEVDFALHGPLATLAAFAAGGTGRKPSEVRVRGRRRRLRKLLKELRAPIGLAEIAAAGGRVEPRDLLVLLAGQLDESQLSGHRFAVDYQLSGLAASVLHVAVDGLARVGDGPAPVGAAATVECADRALPILLGGGTPPSGERATVRGAARSAELLHRLFDEAQGLRR